jgi:hypothetical protein
MGEGSGDIGRKASPLNNGFINKNRETSRVSVKLMASLEII